MLKPTAMQFVAVVQLTAESCVSAPSARGAVVVRDQPDPFHCSAMALVVSPPTSASMPDAMHHADPVHETPVNSASVDPFGSADPALADQLLPFHCSTRVWVPDEVTAWEPTATQNDAEVQDTANKSASVAPAGRGSVTVDQLEPFQSCTNGLAALSSLTTVATQKFDETHETVSS